ncbi:MAG: rRNA pseudouridine synthase [Clostridiales bacterium]|jgi:16S rRNA pseudouridine516 synthase|nr:rRNA pseudouridine synthase [Clostridiales bacterium]
MLQRLDKIIASQGTISRTEVKKAIRSGRVTAAGTVCKDPAWKVDPDQVEIAFDGSPLGYRSFLYVMLNKPAGVLCVSRDPKVPTVVDLLPTAFRRKGLFPAGRLDKDTVGLVIITNDGEYAHRLLSPAAHVVKRYQARLDVPVGKEAAAAFAAGITLADGTKCRPAALRVLPQEEGRLAEVEITEGKYHQVKRMFAAVGCRVVWLKRCSIGGLLLDSRLAEGACRELTEAEKAAVFAACQ